MSRTLRSKVIRLAHANPELQPHLLPLLQKEARGKVIQGDKIRAYIDSYGDIYVEEMTGKPVKRKVRKGHLSLSWLRSRQNAFLSSFIGENIWQDAHLTDAMHYDQAKAAVIKAGEKAVQKALDRAQELSDKYPGKYTTREDAAALLKRWGYDDMPRRWYEEQVSWLEVEPTDYKPIKFQGKDFGGTAKWDSFDFYDAGDKDEYMAQMEGMRAFYSSKSKGAARKLFKWLKAHPDATRRMSVREFQSMLDKNRIGYQYTPTVWR